MQSDEEFESLSKLNFQCLLGSLGELAAPFEVIVANFSRASIKNINK